MTLKEILCEVDPKAQQFFMRIKPIMRKTKPYGWLPEDVPGLARHLSVSVSYFYAMLDSLRNQGLLMRGEKGHYSPHMVAEWVRKCVNKK